MADDILLRVRDLRVHFAARGTARLTRRPPVRAVDGVDLELRRGETLALVGESGCGKSTTGRAILRLVPATTGQVSLAGRDLLALRGRKLRAARRDMQMVFQDPFGSLDRRMTAAESIEEPLIVHGRGTPTQRHARVRELLDQVQLDTGHAHRLPHELSGGQRQRVAIARALALGPSMLVLDEPLSALDVSVQAQVVNLLLDLQRDLGLGYLLISHDLRMVSQIAHRVAVMYLGRIVETGTAAAVCGAPRHPYTRALLSAVPDPARGAGDRIILGGDLPSPARPPAGCTFHTRCPYVREDRCRTVVPALEPALPGHLVACHWQEDIESGRLAPHQNRVPVNLIADRHTA